MEPILVFYVITLTNTVSKQNFYLEKVQRYYSESGISNQLIQSDTSSLISHLVSLETGLSAVLMLVLGPLSDRHGRKPFLLWNLFLGFLCNAAFVMYYVCDQLLGIEFGFYIFYIMVSINGVGGGIYSFFLLTFSYIGDLSKREPETGMKRFTLAEAVGGVGYMLGCLICGQISRRCGDLWVFVISSIFAFISFIYGCFRLENIIPDSKESDDNTAINSDPDSNHGNNSTLSNKKSQSLFSRILRMLMVPFKPRKGNLRCMIIILAICFVLQEIPVTVEDSLLLLYARLMFGWDALDLQQFRALMFGISTVGQFVLLPFLHSVCKFPLLILACLSVVSRCSYYLCIGVGREVDRFYLGAVLNILAGLQPIVNRSLLTELLPQDEIGSMFAMMEVVVASAPSLVTPLGSYIYNQTLAYAPGTWTLLPIGILFLQFPLYLILYCMYREA